MNDEVMLNKLFSSIQTFKNCPSFLPFLNDIIDIVEQESIFNLHSCSKFIIEILKQIILNNELKPKLYWFGNCELIGDSESFVPPLNVNNDHSFFKFKFSPTNPFTQKMEYYRLKNRLTDVKILVGDQVFYAHQIVLQDTCSKWNELLKKREQPKFRDYKESELNIFHEIDLTNKVDPDIFSELLTFFYTSKVTFSVDKAAAFCSAFKFFNIQEVLTKAEVYLCDKVKTGNVIELYCLSERLNMTDLKQRTMKMIVENTEYVFHKKVNDCCAEDLKMLFRELNKEKTVDEKLIYKEHLLHALISWTKVDPSTRGSHVPELLELIPEKSLSDRFLETTAADDEYNRVFCEQYLTYFQQRSSLKLSLTTYKLFCLGGYDDQGRKLNSVSCFEFDTGKWKFSTPMDKPTTHSGGVAVGNKIYVCGGLSSRGKILDTFQFFDCTNETWTILPPMPEPRWMCAAAVMDSFIYVSGGTNKDYSDNFATAFRYCIKSRIWETVSSMHEGRRAHQLVSLEGYLYAIGGISNNFIEQYDSYLDEWKVIEKDQRKKLGRVGSTILDGKIYLCSDSFFEEYTPSSSTPWRSYPALNDIRGTALVSYGGKFFALGGGNQSSKFEGTTNVFMFDGAEWRLQKDMAMNVPRRDHCSFVVKC